MNGTGQKIIDLVRNLVPLKLRWKLGPLVSYAAYFFRMKVLGNKDAPKILSVNQTLDLIIKEKLSVIRFGDGEMSIMENSSLGFQKSVPELGQKLKEVLRANEKGLLICLPDLFGRLEDYVGDAYKFALHHQFRYRHKWLELLIPGRVYGNTFITRPYLAYKQEIRIHSGEVFKKLFSIWKGCNILLIEGEKSRVGVGNDLFSQAASVKRILGPAQNAFGKEQELFNEAVKISKDTLVLLALGPAAKVLGYKLFKEGFRVIDIGHADMEYEMFVRQAPVQTKVKYKYFNEILETSPEDCSDSEYLSQIIAKVL